MFAGGGWLLEIDWGFVGNSAAECDFDFINERAIGKIENITEADARLEMNVVNHAGGGIVKMAVLGKVRTETGRLAVEVDLADDTVMNQRFQAVVNGGERDVGKPVLHPHEYLVGSGVGLFFGEDAVNLTPLTGHPQSADFIRDLDGLGVRVRMHGGGKMEWF